MLVKVIKGLERVFKNTRCFAEDLSSILSAGVSVYSRLKLRIQGIQHLFVASPGIRHLSGLQTYRPAKQSYILIFLK